MPGGSQRVIPPLPEGITILPAKVKAARAKKRVSIGFLIFISFFLFVAAALGALVWFNWYVRYDEHRMDPVVRQAVMDHASKGARFPVTLRNGPRILQFQSIKVVYPTKSDAASGFQPQTCGQVKVIDPATGIQDPEYKGGHWACVSGVVKQTRR